MVFERQVSENGHNGQDDKSEVETLIEFHRRNNALICMALINLSDTPARRRFLIGHAEAALELGGLQDYDGYAAYLAKILDRIKHSEDPGGQ